MDVETKLKILPPSPMSASLSTSPGPSPSPPDKGPSAKALGKRRAASPPSEAEDDPTKRPRIPDVEPVNFILNGTSELDELEEASPSDPGDGIHDGQHTSPSDRDRVLLMEHAPLDTDHKPVCDIELDLSISDITLDPATSASSGVRAPAIDRHPQRGRSLSKRLSSLPIVSSSAKGKQKAQSTISEAAHEPFKPFSAISCPICLGPPSPLTVTRCGHVLFVTLLHVSHSVVPLTDLAAVAAACTRRQLLLVSKAPMSEKLMIKSIGY
jgi:hypothetical protein